MQNERYEKLLCRLQSLSLTYHQYLILQLPFYESRAWVNVPGYARALAPFSFNLPTDEQCFREMKHLWCRDLVQLVTAQSLKRIRLYLRCKPARGPIQGLPQLGQLDLTIAGFRLWEQLWKRSDDLPDEIPTVDFVYRKARSVVIFANDEWTAYSAAADSNFIPIAEPMATGAWRSNWWHLLPSGVSLRCLTAVDT